MSNKYGTASGFTLYVVERNYSAPAASDDDIESALVVASTWVDSRTRSAVDSSSSYKTGGRDQERDWPRTSWIDRDGYAIPAGAVPREIEQATYEAALRQLRSPGALTVDFTPGKAIRQAAVAGAVSVTYAGGGSVSDAQLMIPTVDAILASLIGDRRSTSSSLSGGTLRV